MSFEIEFFSERCLRSMHRASRCTLCYDACTSRAITFLSSTLQFDPLKCVECTACVALCPTDAFESKITSNQRLSEYINEKGNLREKIVFTCKNAHLIDTPSMELPCLARLELSFVLACCASNTDSLTCVHGRCEACVHSKSVERFFEQTLLSARAVVASLHLGIRIDVLNINHLKKEIKPRVLGMTKEGHMRRRALLSLFGKHSSDKEARIQTTSPLDALKKTSLQKTSWYKHHQLLEATKTLLLQSSTQQTTKVATLPVIHQAMCQACTICVRVCPLQALKLQNEESFQIWLSPSACVGCRLCGDVCFAQAITFEQCTLKEILRDEPIRLLKQNLQKEACTVRIYRT